MKREREMERIAEEEVVIVGAGIAGLATAVALKRVGIRALVLERSDCLRATGAALTLFPNAWRALDALGVSHKLTPLYAVREKYDFCSFIVLLFNFGNSRHTSCFLWIRNNSIIYSITVWFALWFFSLMLNSSINKVFMVSWNSAAVTSRALII